MTSLNSSFRRQSAVDGTITVATFQFGFSSLVVVLGFPLYVTVALVYTSSRGQNQCNCAFNRNLKLSLFYILNGVNLKFMRLYAEEDKFFRV